LETLPQRIETLEEERTEIIAALSSSEFYAASDPARVAATNARLEALELELEEAYSRWEKLEGIDL
jgi:ATP-binding cassette subfamily F protein uup